jgi:hypothetical protein
LMNSNFFLLAFIERNAHSSIDDGVNEQGK